MLEAAADKSVVWDILVIGGGATGLGIAVDAAARGYRTLLLEGHDFGKGTSSRSTKLIHGGVRYLQQGNIKLVREALYERGLLLQHAPHLVHPISFVIPNYSWWSRFYYGAGLKAYDAMAGKHRMERSQHLSRKETLELLPTLNANRLVGGTMYWDGQFDDARLAITLARTASELGGALINYMPVIALTKENGKVTGVVARDDESGQEYLLRCRALLNATGVFTDSVRRLDSPNEQDLIAPSQGAHIVLPRSFLPGNAALMVPKTDDGRVLFAIPWHERVLVGTTDTPITSIEAEPRPLASEIDFLLTHTGRYLTKAPTSVDILTSFAGLRPLVKPSNARHTALIPRDHVIAVSESGLISVTGGKWTTYRRMAEDAVNRAISVASLPARLCRTHELPLHGAEAAKEGAARTVSPLTPALSPLRGEGDNAAWLHVYGSDASQLRDLSQQNIAWTKSLHPRLPYIHAEVIWAVRHEMARTVEDVLARRTRALFLDAAASAQAAPLVATLLSQELGRDSDWIEDQVRQYSELIRGYCSFNG